MKWILKHLLWVAPLLIVIGVVALLVFTATARGADVRFHSTLRKTIQVSSENFQDNQEMPVAVSCKGRSISPHIQWTGAPEGTKSYALIAMDWDAPSPRFRLFSVVHWILYNIPSDMMRIPQDSDNDYFRNKNIVPGLNFARQAGYMAPCPPLGLHRYEFRVYALDVDQIQPATGDRSGVMKAMEGHILAYGELVGLRKP